MGCGSSISASVGPDPKLRKEGSSGQGPTQDPNPAKLPLAATNTKGDVDGRSVVSQSNPEPESRAAAAGNGGHQQPGAPQPAGRDAKGLTVPLIAATTAGAVIGGKPLLPEFVLYL